jgi:hypothetical protein
MLLLNEALFIYWSRHQKNYLLISNPFVFHASNQINNKKMFRTFLLDFRIIIKYNQVIFM